MRRRGNKRLINLQNTEARKHLALCIQAVRMDMHIAKRRWKRSTILNRAADMLCRHAREASAAGFLSDSHTLAAAMRAAAEAA